MCSEGVLHYLLFFIISNNFSVVFQFPPDFSDRFADFNFTLNSCQNFIYLMQVILFLTHETLMNIFLTHIFALLLANSATKMIKNSFWRIFVIYIL
jgi:hypothetical protein